jgi:hypothetical protein
MSCFLHRLLRILAMATAAVENAVAEEVVVETAAVEEAAVETAAAEEDALVAVMAVEDAVMAVEGDVVAVVEGPKIVFPMSRTKKLFPLCK